MNRRGVASSIRAFLNNAGMVISMAIATPLIIGTLPLDQMMDMFVLGGAQMPVADQIAFTHIVGNLRIAVMDPSGGSLRYLTDSWQDEAPTWAPNGRVIQFFRTTKTTGKTGLWQVDLTGRNERRLETPVDGSDPAWGPLRP